MIARAMIRLKRMAVLLLGLATMARAADSPAPVDFNREVRPLLSEYCFQCHGQDASQRKAGLRLDTRAGALAVREGKQAVFPGKPEASALLRRIQSNDPDQLMPPPETQRSLSAEQKAVLKRWISEGARYDQHWAFVPPRRLTPPGPARPIDAWIQSRLAREGLAPSPPATPEAWLRRVSLDLTGLPPALDELNRFSNAVQTQGEPAWASEVDRLLSSPRFGERMAIDWLDAARYADTHGFNNDSARSMWRWREWVIESFNANLPYDRFITEQLAGDLLPQATLDQRIATGFSRNHVINSEGGIIDEEYRVEYVADRVRTFSTAWLGLTLECARCHDHKFDPISQRDYYGLFAFFNNVPEHGEDGRIANAVPLLPAPTPLQRREMDRQLAEIKRLDRWIEQASRQALPLPPSPATPIQARSSAGRTERENTNVISLFLSCDNLLTQGQPFSFPSTPPELIEGVAQQAWKSQRGPLARLDKGILHFTKPATVALWIRPDENNSRDVALFSNVSYSGNPAQQGFGKGQEIRLMDGQIEVRWSDFFPAYALRVRGESAPLRAGEWRHLAVVLGGSRSAADVRIFLDGEEIPTRVLYDGLTSKDAPSTPYQIGAELTPGAPSFQGAVDELRILGRAPRSGEIRAWFAEHAEHLGTRAGTGIPSGARHITSLRRAPAKSTDAKLRANLEERDRLWENHLAYRRALPSTMVMSELPEPRPTFILRRGAYDAQGDRVEPSVPESTLAPWPAGAPKNRLGLARWLTHPEHPLTARVVVNRMWAQLFGVGLVKTLEDFGSQGEYPSHPELLDWLARDFIESGWNVKGLLRAMTLSQTYRQTSAAPPESFARDPENRLLARSPRLRLPAEVLRDQALALSGMLQESLGGESVFPYQPEELYKNIVVGADYPGTRWNLSRGRDLYRRSLYTFWKRTLPHPAMLTFDAPDREFCTVRRSRTNTPLQALILMNEPLFVEAAQRLGARIQSEGGIDLDARLRWAFRLATSRNPSVSELVELKRAMAPSLEGSENHAYASLAGILLNLDETISRE
ncbi:MAG: DUF1553 domain-containing protein [Verrucomicrobia bacterium]|nr:DUF1553 domain-containing protein [Verrucomicrobiota bacterium]